ncbi:HAD-IC family P-type ATPase [Schaalia hyovaginalis]|uniref:HAD-IC family P-type ATPase n=1 Tax=Schaalia hyovaginalis TaxID=29316 RepID=UPI0026EF19A2|nr:HAD-IC family P-type ATPase [Schaalia hyovaginalis]MCI6556324.1 HAD-IC family P-type ATPase [Schaalia hyovaginalis]MDD7554054.1 HAD-IC family P-type ATPase [Schaalia hyovaginalis]MDY3093000.1 HAD-IC family P-type ATPase [Schaalia hyovaginalis]
MPSSVPTTALKNDAPSPTQIGEGARASASLLKRRFLISLPFGLTALVLSMFPALQFTGWQWTVAAASIPVVTWGAWPFHRAAFAAGRHGSTTMDTLVSLGVTASSLWSWWALLFGGAGELGMRMSMTLLPRAAGHHAEIYFEGATTIVLFLLLGRWMEARTRYRAGDALRSLLELGAKEATLLRIDETSGQRTETRVHASSLTIGDLFLVRPGEKVATDGVIESGHSALDASLLTGESLPVDVGPGDEATGATVNTWGALEVRATRVGADTALARISRTVAEAQAGKAPVQRLADRISSVFVPTVIAIAILTFAGWLIAGSSLQAAFTAGVAVLVVACPCALGLATPTALLVGSGRAARLGIVIKSAEILEQTRSVDTMVLDKTGTVTTGRMSLHSITPTPPGASPEAPREHHPCAAGDPAQDRSGAPAPEDLLLALAAGVESASEHPVARAIVQGAAERSITPLPASSFTNHAGLGVSALVDHPSTGTGLALVARPSWLESKGAGIPAELRTAIDRAESEGSTAVLAALVPDWSDEPARPLPASGLREAPTTPGSPAPLATLTMNVQGMTCASCVRRVERKLSKLEGVTASVNLATESATITLSAEHTDSELEEVVNAAGYTGRVLSRTLPGAAEAAAPPSGASGDEGGRALPARLGNARILGALTVRDTVKETSPEAIASLARLRIEPILLTGDNAAAARRVADEVGIARVIAEVLPEDKRSIIASLQDEGRVVAMVGDGVNDAAALAQAGVRGLGIAMGSGTDAAIEVADITLVNSDLVSAATAIRISRRTLAIIKGNLFWAFAYNVAMIPLAIAGLLNPMLAAAAMAFSSVFVVLNSLRLRSAH